MASKTPFADGLRHDMQALGEVLARHTRGLNEHLHGQAARIQRREADVVNNLLPELEASEVVQDAPPLDTLGDLTVKELKARCKQQGLKGYSKKCRADLLQLLKAEQATIKASSRLVRLEALMVLIAKTLEIPQEHIDQALSS